MKLDLSTIELEREDLDHLHDIKLDAVKYGCSDTPTRDAIFIFLQDKYANS